MSSTHLFFRLAQVLGIVLGMDFGFSHRIVSFILDLPYSHPQELEADRIGLHLAGCACFRPEAALESVFISNSGISVIG
jgi:Zn-dependent protease with chaperone function